MDISCLGHLAVQWKLTEHCKPTIMEKNKNHFKIFFKMDMCVCMRLGQFAVQQNLKEYFTST